MAFGTKAVIAVEVGLLSLKRAHYDESLNNAKLRLSLDCLSKVKDKTAQRMAQYQ